MRSALWSRVKGRQPTGIYMLGDGKRCCLLLDFVPHKTIYLYFSC